MLHHGQHRHLRPVLDHLAILPDGDAHRRDLDRFARRGCAGELALVTDETVVVAVLTDGAAPERTLHNLAEAQARDADAIGIVSDPDHADCLDHAFTTEATGITAPLVANIYLQLFAYHLADRLGRPIDRPRNLAKSVTVE